MLLDNWNQDEYVEVRCEEAREEGREEGHEDGLREGEEIGMGKGIEKEKLIIAKNLLSEGSTPEFVHRITGLSLEQIKEL
jgi:predicted transposase/invertase (TIGR01784 family)